MSRPRGGSSPASSLCIRAWTAGSPTFVSWTSTTCGDKSALVSALVAWGAPRGRIEAEIAHCEVRCANCHRRVTARRAGWSRLAGDVDDPRRGFSAPVRRNLRHVHEVLAGGHCVDCGETDMLVLEFDHVGAKRGQISTMVWNVSFATLLAEIAKCEIRCCNCHRRATAKRRGTAAPDTVYSLGRAAVAQLVEQPTFNRSRAGSSPAGGIPWQRRSGPSSRSSAPSRSSR